MEECLGEFLDSLVAQSFDNYEVICVNDGSTDGSLGIIEKYANMLPSFTLIDQTNAGVAAARNTGMSHARGRYLMLLDSDDLLEPTLLKSMVEAAEETQADVVACRSDEFHHKTGIWHRTPWATRVELLPNRNPFTPEEAGGNLFRAFAGWPWDKLYRTSFITSNHLEFPPLRNSEDLCFVYAALTKASAIALIDDVLVHHRTCRSESVSNSQPSNPRDFYRAISILKANLKQQPNYSIFEQGLLNWAIDFSLWNIEGLPKGSARSMLIDDLLTNSLSDLEMAIHPNNYFSLYPKTMRRLAALEKERLGGRMSTRRSPTNICATAWNYIRTLDIAATVKYAVKRKGGSSPQGPLPTNATAKPFNRERRGSNHKC